MIRIILADNQAIFRAGTARVLTEEADLTVLAQCSDAGEFLQTMATARSAVVLLAQSLGADLDKTLRGLSANSNRLILLTDTSAEPAPAILSRLDGLLTRHTCITDLLQCVRRVGSGERTVGISSTNPADVVSHRMLSMLTPREMQIVGFIVRGLKNRQIADELGTREQMVKNNLRSIYDKTGSSDRLELALFTLHHRVLAQAAAQSIAALVQAKPDAP